MYVFQKIFSLWAGLSQQKSTSVPSRLKKFCLKKCEFVGLQINGPVWAEIEMINANDGLLIRATCGHSDTPR